MNLMSRILPPENIVLDLPVTSKEEAIEQAALLFENHNGVARAAAFECLMARERLGSTALGHFVAVPHARLKSIKQPCAAFLRLATPVQFDSNDGRTANLIFCLLVPEAAKQLHLDLLSEVARLMSDATVRQALATESDPKQLHQLLTTILSG